MADQRIHKLIEYLPCPHCGKPIDYTLAHAGTAGKCPSCGEMVRLPDRDVAVLEEIRSLLTTIRNVAILIATLTVLQFLLFIMSY